VTPSRSGLHRELTRAGHLSAKSQCGGLPTASIPKTRDQLEEEANSKCSLPSGNNTSTGISPVPPIRQAAQVLTIDTQRTPHLDAGTTTGNACTEKANGVRTDRPHPAANPRRAAAKEAVVRPMQSWHAAMAANESCPARPSLRRSSPPRAGASQPQARLCQLSKSRVFAGCSDPSTVPNSGRGRPCLKAERLTVTMSWFCRVAYDSSGGGSLGAGTSSTPDWRRVTALDVLGWAGSALPGVLGAADAILRLQLFGCVASALLVIFNAAVHVWHRSLSTSL
jgi:hypothetical protein